MSTFKLIYRPEEPNHWHRVEMPDINDYGYFESDPEIPGSGWGKKEYDEAVKKAIDEAKPIAPQDQEKVKRFLAINNGHWVPQEGSGTWQPDPSKLYDSGELEFETEFICPNGHKIATYGLCVYPHCHQHNEQFWALRSEEKMEKGFVSASCEGEKCFCGNPATNKVGEEILHDDPLHNRHNLTSYVCKEHFDMIFKHE